VRDIEKSRGGSRPQVFFDSPSRVLYGHVPPTEINHPRSHPTVSGVECRLFECWLGRQSVSLTPQDEMDEALERNVIETAN
jgi:hypothetical protein